MAQNEVTQYIDTIRVVINHDYVPNENVEPYFTVTAYGIFLPWKSDETYEDTFEFMVE